MWIYAKDLLTLYLASKKFGHIFCGATEPIFMLTDNKSVTRLFQTKVMPTPLWNACDFVLHFILVIAHTPGKTNTVAVSSSRLEADANEKIVLNIREDIPTRHREVYIQSTGISLGKPVFNTVDDLTEVPEQKIWQRKAEIRNTAPSQPPAITISAYSHIDLPKGRSIIDMAYLKKPSKILIEQDFHPKLQGFKRKLLGLPFEIQVTKNEARWKHYSRKRKRIILKADIL